jgi:CTP:molybdopterin cytidylyltransferase MocA
MGRAKLLLPFKDGTMLGSLVSALRKGGIAELVIVTHPCDHDLQEWCDEEGIASPTNPRPERGMLSSIQEGLEFLGGAEALLRRGQDLMVCPGDYPGIKPHTIRLLLDRMGSLQEALVAPTFQGQRGHPILISRALTLRIKDLDPARGLRALLELYPQQVQEVDVADPATVRDVDTPSDYEGLARDP